ncbi:PD-(D/E)XK nuclease family protein [Actinomyces viscosus]|uniref:PD-(D/E)XK nuclease family protein n=1 Tax=Actinomyces viscosus TaxID=1656 RepID=UPI0028EDB584|nr:PD-(D/E)XK nuclease family protein [Actinomyces viscosus]
MSQDPIHLLPPLEAPELPSADADGLRVLDRVAEGSNVVVLGAPGTGKTSLALRLLSEAVAGGRDAVLLAPTRARADALRGRAAHLLREGHGDGVVRVRTPAALALTILTTSLTRRPDPLPPPVLLAGAEEDSVLASMISTITWPGLPAEATGSRAFRSELRNLLARAGELGITADELADLGRRLNVPIWGPSAHLLRTWDAQGRASAERRAQTRKMDTARLQDRAVEALRAWDSDGVTVPRPVPDLVIVDDYQDCTAATARLLAGLAAPDPDGHRAQIVVLGDPDVAVETFRGGTPSLLIAAEDHSGLGATRLQLTTCHRGNPAIAAAVADQSARVPVTGTASHRQTTLSPGSSVRPSSRTPDDDRPAAPAGVEAILASSTWQERAHVARALRLEHVHHATPWSQMAVIVRSAGDAEALARDLRRRGVPLASRTPAVLLRAEPAAAALLDIVRAAVRGQLGETGRPPQREAAINLLTSPLVGLTTMDLRRLRRRLRQHPEDAGRSAGGAEPAEPAQPAEPAEPAEPTPGTGPRTSADTALLALLAQADQAAAFARSLDDEPLGAQAGRLLTAARIIEALRTAVGDSPAGSPRDVEALLWAAWNASGRAEAWRTTALRPSGSSVRSLLSEAAEHDLDVVTTLFKRAEVWAERHPGQDASSFLAELDAEVLPSDSVAPQGRRPEGVAVMTPARCAGQEWELVVIAGLERDRWPDLRLRDSLTRTGLLVDAVTGRLPAGVNASGDGEEAGGSGAVAAARAQVRADERRMLIMALSRATRRLLLTATADADHAPSPFLTEIARTAGIALTDADGAPVLSPDTGDLTLRGLVGELRLAAVAGNLETATAAERRRGQEAVTLLADLASQDVPGADPSTWIGAGDPTSTAPLVAAGERIRVSPSDVEGLTACPLKWFLTRNGGSAPASGAQALGSLIHTVAEKAEGEHLRGPALREAFEERLGDLGHPDTWQGGLAAERARAMIERLDAYLSDCDALGIRADVEQPVRADVDIPLQVLSPEVRNRAAHRMSPAGLDAVPVRIAGRIDRLEHLGDRAVENPDGSAEGAGNSGVRVIDLKTGQRVPKDVQRHPQLATYRLALGAQGHDVAGGALVLLGKEPSKRSGDGYVLAPPGAALDPSPAAPEPEDRSGDELSDGDANAAAEAPEQYWAEDLVAGAAVAGLGPLLEARTGDHCRTCMVKDSCPVQVEGRRVVS